MEIGQTEYYNIFQDGGFEIKCIAKDKFELYEIPLFGGTPQYIDTFFSVELAKQKADTLC